MWATAVLASALVRPATVLTAVCSSRRWLGTSCTEYIPGMSLALVQGSTVHGSGKDDNRADDGSGRDGIQTGGGRRIGGSGKGGGGDDDKDPGGAGPESGGYMDSVGRGIDGWLARAAVGRGGGSLGGGRGGKVVGDGGGGDVETGGSDDAVGDAGKGGKGGRGNGGPVKGLLPAKVLSALVRLGTTTSWACCARRSCCNTCIPTATSRGLDSALVEAITPGGSGKGDGHVSHATGHLVRATK